MFYRGIAEISRLRWSVYLSLPRKSENRLIAECSGWDPPPPPPVHDWDIETFARVILRNVPLWGMVTIPLPPQDCLSITRYMSSNMKSGHKTFIFPQKTGHFYLTSIGSNFFVFQSYELRFSEIFFLDLKRSFPGSFAFGVASRVVNIISVLNRSISIELYTFEVLYCYIIPPQGYPEHKRH